MNKRVWSQDFNWMSAVSWAFINSTRFLCTPTWTLSASISVNPIISSEPSLEVYLSLLLSRVQCLSLKPGFRSNVCYAISFQNQALDPQHTNMGTLHGHYSALLKNRVELILEIRKHKTHKWAQFNEIKVVEAVSWCSWKLHRRRFQRTIVHLISTSSRCSEETSTIFRVEFWPRRVPFLS